MLNADLFRDRRSQLAKVVLVLCGLYFAVAFAGQAWRAKELTATLDAERAKLAEHHQVNRELEVRAAYLRGPGYAVYAERTARTKLGMVKPADTPLFVVPDRTAPVERPETPLPVAEPKPAPTPARPTWRQWLEVFAPQSHGEAP